MGDQVLQMGLTNMSVFPDQLMHDLLVDREKMYFVSRDGKILYIPLAFTDNVVSFEGLLFEQMSAKEILHFITTEMRKHA